MLFDDFFKSHVKQIPPEELLTRGIIQLANDGKSFACPTCNNGKTGHAGDGLTPSLIGGVYTWHCFACNSSFDNFGIIAAYYGLDVRADFHELCNRISQDFNISNFSTPPTPTPVDIPEKLAQDNKEFEIVTADIEKAHANLKNFVDSQGGSYRGLTFETLDKYHCGFLNDWTPPISRANNKKRTPTPRVIVPSGVHYLARLTVPLDNFKNVFDFQYIKEKIHARPKYPFGLDFVTADATKIFIVEGEFDAMSLNQVFGGKFSAAIATMGAAVGRNITAEIFNRLDEIFKDIKKPFIILLFDYDNAGKTNAPKLCEEFIKRGYPAVFDFYKSDDGIKIDANSILTSQGEDILRTATIDIVCRNADKFENLRANIDKIQAEFAERAELQRLQLEKAEKEKILRREIFSLPHSDLGNSTRIFKMFGDVIRFNTEIEKWGLFNDGVWRFPTSSASALYPYTRKIADFIANNRPKYSYIHGPNGQLLPDTLRPQPKNPEDVNIAESLSKKWQQAKTQRNAIELLKGVEEILITQKDLDAYPFLLNVKNGVLDLEKGILRPAAPELFLTKQANVIFNPNAKAPIFENFISQILPDDATRAAVLRWLGYCLTGSVREEKFLFVHGSGGNGKGTLFKTIQAMLNDYATSFKIDTVLKQKFPKDGEAASPEIAKLCGARLAIAPEIPPGREIDTALVKNLSGGDILTARFLHSNSFNFAPTHKFIFEGNDLPRPENVRDVGFLRRFQVVDFTEQFTDNADPTLKDKLTAKEELSGILNILLRECLAWQSEGLISSSAMDTTRKEYLAENDFISNFINDNCIFDAEKSIPRKNFIERLKKEYPQAHKFTNKKLIDMICSTGNILQYIGGKKRINYLKGIAWADEAQSELNLN